VRDQINILAEDNCL